MRLPSSLEATETDQVGGQPRPWPLYQNLLGSLFNSRLWGTDPATALTAVPGARTWESVLLVGHQVTLGREGSRAHGSVWVESWQDAG